MARSKAAVARKVAVSARMSAVRAIEDAASTAPDGAMALAWQDAARLTRERLRPQSARVAQ